MAVVQVDIVRIPVCQSSYCCLSKLATDLLSPTTVRLNPKCHRVRFPIGSSRKLENGTCGLSRCGLKERVLARCCHWFAINAAFTLSVLNIFVAYKAFDRINCNILFTKLMKCNVPVCIVGLLASWYMNQSRQVKSCVHIYLLFILFNDWASSFTPLVGRSTSWHMFWAAIRLSCHTVPTGHAFHREVDVLDSEGQHLFLCTTLTSQRRGQISFV